MPDTQELCLIHRNYALCQTHQHPTYHILTPTYTHPPPPTHPPHHSNFLLISTPHTINQQTNLQAPSPHPHLSKHQLTSIKVALMYSFTTNPLSSRTSKWPPASTAALRAPLCVGVGVYVCVCVCVYVCTCVCTCVSIVSLCCSTRVLCVHMCVYTCVFDADTKWQMVLSTYPHPQLTGIAAAVSVVQSKAQPHALVNHANLAAHLLHELQDATQHTYVCTYSLQLAEMLQRSDKHCLMK